ncbi:hypothetical protein CPB83DRAFT_848045 [Crepidotus variabilis]|uniref:Uncharacterized protein n=1 Tax=Crepidotus variabilis TaxID=179855 RepID=A0A9P6EN62_9AGAR|nr:hypothetical protein CPB83DRAFT_848045 [Crepidotus variabilis]
MKMRAIHLIILICFLCIDLAHCRPWLSLPSYALAARDLLGIIGDDVNNAATPVTLPIVKETPISSNPPGQISPTALSTLTASTSTPTAGALNSIGALGVSRLPEAPQSTDSLSLSQSDSPTSTSSPTPSGSPWVGDASSTPPAELTQWKVIGIGVITVTFIAIIILAVSFFDSWWGFIRAVFFGGPGGKGKLQGEETMVPDHQIWEINLASEDGHRYPTMASLESIAKEKDRLSQWSLGESVHGNKATMPELAYGGV